MGCPNEDRAILIGHSLGRHQNLSSVNVEHYTEDDIDFLLELYDKWFPYGDLSF